MNQTERIKTQELRRVIYELRKRWGVPADLYKVSVGEPNLDTGDNGITIQKIYIPELLCGGFTFFRQFQRVTQGGNFQYGGFFEVGDLFVVLMANTTIAENDYFVVRKLKYNIKMIHQMIDDIHLLHLRQTSGEQFSQIYDLFVRSSITVDQEITHDL